MPQKKKSVKAKKSPKSKRSSSKASKSRPSNVISFTELYELRKQRLAEAQQQTSWKDGTTGMSVGSSGESSKPMPQLNVRNGRTNGSGSRHH